MSCTEIINDERFLNPRRNSLIAFCSYKEIFAKWVICGWGTTETGQEICSDLGAVCGFVEIRIIISSERCSARVMGGWISEVLLVGGVINGGATSRPRRIRIMFICGCISLRKFVACINLFYVILALGLVGLVIVRYGKLVGFSSF